MKRMIIVLLFPLTMHAQYFEVQQLLLNVEKLSQFKAMLQDMYDGWKLVNQGYTAIKDISSGNFSLHKGFLDALMDVSPAVRRYERIAAIVNFQLQIIKQGRAAVQLFKSDKAITVEEGRYVTKVFDKLLQRSMESIDELALVITAGKLRMSDDERIKAIDRVYAEVNEQFSFLQEFTNSTKLLLLQRKSAQAEIDLSKRLQGK